MRDQYGTTPGPFTIDLWVDNPDNEDAEPLVSLDFEHREDAIACFEKPEAHFGPVDLFFSQYVAYDCDEVCNKRILHPGSSHPVHFFGRVK